MPVKKYYPPTQVSAQLKDNNVQQQNLWTFEIPNREGGFYVAKLYLYVDEFFLAEGNIRVL